jgi:hypothetical protein
MPDVRQTVDAIFEGYLTNLAQLDETVELLEAYFHKLSPEAHREFFDLFWRRLSSEPVSHLAGKRTSHEVVIRAWASFGPTDSLPAHIFAILDWKDPLQMESWAVKIGSEFVYSLFSYKQRFSSVALKEIKSHLGLLTSQKSPELVGVTFPVQLLEVSQRINIAIDKINFENFQKGIIGPPKISPPPDRQSVRTQPPSPPPTSQYQESHIVDGLGQNDSDSRPRPVKATILNVLIASPSDVNSERNAVESAIHEWNASHYARTGIMLHPVRWETHSYPASGDRPQAILNKQIVESGNILIGIFGHKLGTPTGKAQSGTIEEIEEFRKAGKYVALYFSTGNVPRSADRDQLKALEDYQRERKKDTLYGTFQSTEELRRLVTRHLPKIVAEVSQGGIEDLTPRTASTQSSRTYAPCVDFSERKQDLSPKEIELLWNAAKAPPGEILHNFTLDGESIRVNGRQFLAGVDTRTGAEWVAAFRSLEKRDFIEPLSQGSDFFRVTGDGYLAADAFKEFARWDVTSVTLRAHYFRGTSDELTISCTSIIAIPARYFDDQIGADEWVQRSLKERPSLILEGITSKPVVAWSPTEIEFLVGKQVQTFPVEGMKFLQPRSLKLSLAAETVQADSASADDGLHEVLESNLLSATEEPTAAARPESESGTDGFVIGSRNAWIRFLEQCWPIIGPQILSLAREPGSTVEDVRRALLPAKDHAHDSGLATHFYRERIQQATPADVVSTGMRFDQLAAEILQATADKDHAARSCAEAEAALGFATNPKDKEHVERVVQQRKENLTQLDGELAELQCAQKNLEETLRDQQAYVCRSEMLDFLLVAEQSVDPRHIANAVAALPRKAWRESVALCLPIPFDSYVQHEYQVFLVISAILNDHAFDFNGRAVEAFRRALLKLPSGSPGQPFFWDNWGDLRYVIEEFGNSAPLDPFRLTDMLLKRTMRQKDPLEKVLADSERLRP